MSALRLYTLCLLLAVALPAVRAQLPDVDDPAEALTGVSDTTQTAEEAEPDTLMAPGMLPLSGQEIDVEDLADLLGLPGLPDAVGTVLRPVELILSLGKGWPGISPLRAADAHTPLWWLRLLLLPALAVGAWLTTRRRDSPPPADEAWAEAMERRSRQRDLRWGWGTAAGGIYLAHGGAVAAGGILLLSALWRHLRKRSVAPPPDGDAPETETLAPLNEPFSR